MCIALWNSFVFSFRHGETDFITSLKENFVLKVTLGRFFTTDEARCDWKLYRGSNRQVTDQQYLFSKLPAIMN